MFCGGSHFLRKSFYTDSPYLPNKYGYEEIPPSLIAFDAGKINAFYPELCIIHKPAINKWDWNDEKNHALLVKDIALPYAIKKMMYPAIFRPILALAHAKRMSEYLSEIPDGKDRVREVAEVFCSEYPINKKIRILTIAKMFRNFKLSVF